MREQDYSGEGAGDGQWGSGLLWPVVRIAVMVLCAAAVIHWMVGALSSGAASPRTMAVSNLPEDTSAYEAGGGREIVLHANRAGQFLLDAVVNGEKVRFLVDTGAGPMVLSPADARRVGFNTNSLAFSERYQTANGVAIGAPVTLREFRVGSFSIYDAPATVMARPIPVSLLGMSVLSRFTGHEVEGNRLVLRY